MDFVIQQQSNVFPIDQLHPGALFKQDSMLRSRVFMIVCAPGQFRDTEREYVHAVDISDGQIIRFGKDAQVVTVTQTNTLELS